MSLLIGNLTAHEQGLNTYLEHPFGGQILRLYGTARVDAISTAPQLSIPVFQRVDFKGLADTPLTIPNGAYVIQTMWTIPSFPTSPSAQSFPTDGIRGTSTDLIKLATSGQGVTVTAANSLGGVSDAFGSDATLGANYNKTYGKRINPYDNAASSVTGLGSYASGTGQDVIIYSVDSTGIAAGSGIYDGFPSVGTGYGYPGFIDIPVYVDCWLPANCPRVSVYGQVASSLPLQ